MKNISSYIITGLIALLVSLLVAAYQAPSQNQQKESHYERVLRTKTLRCGYVANYPSLNIDVNTKQISGIMYDTLMEAGRLLDIKIDWAEEMGWVTTVEALQSGRVDAICTNFWMEPSAGKYLGHTMPLYWTGIHAYIRHDDHRFDGDLSRLNDPQYKIASVDGDMAALMAGQDFPKAKVYSLPNATDLSQQMLSVATAKADITFVEPAIADDFMRHNPGMLRRLSEHPLRVYANTIALPMDDARLQHMLDATLIQLLHNGFIDRALTKYSGGQAYFYPVALPYKP